MDYLDIMIQWFLILIFIGFGYFISYKIFEEVNLKMILLWFIFVCGIATFEEVIDVMFYTFSIIILSVILYTDVKNNV